MNWYVVYLLFAQPENSDDAENVVCETCQVLFSASSALTAYDKGISWAAEHVEESDFQLVGIEHIHSLHEEPADGVEIGGHFYTSEDIWQRKSELIPEKSELSALLWEKNSNVPIGEFMTEEHKNVLKRIFDKTDDS